MTGQVVVVGSINQDISLQVTRLPQPGETLLAHTSRRSGGGKGANQAIGAARAGGASVGFIGCVGADAAGTDLLTALAHEGIDTTCVRTVEQPTGTAIITVDAKGENTIVVDTGANARLAIHDAERALLARADVVLAQLEVPQDALQMAARARRPGAVLVLNAAPAHDLLASLWAQVDVLVVNETEALQLSACTDIEMACQTLLQRVRAVLVTLGAAGSLWVGADGRRVSCPTRPTVAVDTVAAGDTYCGVLAAWLAAGRDLEQSLRAASTAASLAVERPGAQDSIPTIAELTAALAR